MVVFILSCILGLEAVNGSPSVTSLKFSFTTRLAGTSRRFEQPGYLNRLDFFEQVNQMNANKKRFKL